MTYYIAGLPYSAELYHHGIKGQKWGIRRYQNPDGTRTDAGKKRYNSSGLVSKSDPSNSNNRERLKKAAKVAAAAAGTALAGYGVYRLAKSGALNKVAAKAQEKISESKAQRENNIRRLKDAANAFKFSDEELAEKVKRLSDEAELRRLTFEAITNPADPAKRTRINAGRKIMETALTGAGLYTIKALLTNKINPKDAADYLAPKPKKK